MEAWAIKNEQNLYFLEYPNRQYWTDKAMSVYKTKDEAENVIYIWKLKNFKPVKVRIEEAEG